MNFYYFVCVNFEWKCSLHFVVLINDGRVGNGTIEITVVSIMDDGSHG